MSQPSATQGTPVWVELRAEKVPGPGYSWVIDGRSDPASDPADPESWGWVASVNSSEHVWDHEPGETARQLVLRWSSHTPLIEALAGLLSRNGHAAACGGNDQGFPCANSCAAARSALTLARDGEAR